MAEIKVVIWDILILEVEGKNLFFASYCVPGCCWWTLTCGLISAISASTFTLSSLLCMCQNPLCLSLVRTSVKVT